MTDTSSMAIFKPVLYIWYPVQFSYKNNKDKKENMRALIDLSDEVNTMYQIYATRSDLYRKVDIDT